MPKGVDSTHAPSTERDVYRAGIPFLLNLPPSLRAPSPDSGSHAHDGSCALYTNPVNRISGDWISIQIMRTRHLRCDLDRRGRN